MTEELRHCIRALRGLTAAYESLTRFCTTATIRHSQGILRSCIYVNGQRPVGSLPSSSFLLRTMQSISFVAHLTSEAPRLLKTLKVLYELPEPPRVLRFCSDIGCNETIKNAFRSFRATRKLGRKPCSPREARSTSQVGVLGDVSPSVSRVE